MKLFLLFLLVGCATAASIYDALKDAEESLSLFANDDTIKTEIGKQLKEALDKVLEKIKDHVDEGEKVSENLLNLLDESLKELIKKYGRKWKDYLDDFIDSYLKLKQKENKKRSVKDMWEKIKDYFKGLNLDIKEKHAKFGVWVKEHYKKDMEASYRLGNIKNIAKMFIDQSKGVSKDVAAQALEFLRPYRDGFAILWEQVKDTVKDIMNRKE